MAGSTSTIGVQTPTNTLFTIGYYANGEFLNGCIKRITYTPKALPQDNLLAMVTN